MRLGPTRSLRTALARAALLIVAPALALGCSDLSGFELPDGGYYEGAVVGATYSEQVPCLNGNCSFIRRGFFEGTKLRLDLDLDHIDSTPGTLTTSREPCTPVFDETPLLPIPALSHDLLSSYDFPGGGRRVANYIFALEPTDGPLAGRDVLAFVSLLRGREVEVRILAGSGENLCDPSDCAALGTQRCDYFGLFRLEPVEP
ncbi:MAG: hypothetical protein KC543_14630 [Myxococcales bacterium]|nr:hypothetical protein [Myxococcales bacterium]